MESFHKVQYIIINSNVSPREFIQVNNKFLSRQQFHLMFNSFTYEGFSQPQRLEFEGYLLYQKQGHTF